MMSPDYYHRWITSGFEADASIDKPSYQKSPVVAMPEIKKPQKVSHPKTREQAKVHTITHSERFIEHEGFQVVADDDGQILTDMHLLAYLCSFRSQIMKYEINLLTPLSGIKGLLA